MEKYPEEFGELIVDLKEKVNDLKKSHFPQRKIGRRSLKHNQAFRIAVFKTILLFTHPYDRTRNTISKNEIYDIIA